MLERDLLWLDKFNDPLGAVKRLPSFLNESVTSGGKLDGVSGADEELEPDEIPKLKNLIGQRGP